MPIYSIQGPDGKIYEIEGPPGATKAQVVAAIQAKMRAPEPAPEPVAIPKIEPQKREGFGAAFGKGLEGLISPSRTAIGAVTGSAEEAALAGLKRAEESPYADQVSLDKVKQAYQRGLLPAAGEVLRQIPLAITEQAPNIAATLGSARLGAMAGAGLGSVVPGLGTAVGTIGGGILGAVAPSLLQQFGGNIQRQAQEQLEAKKPVDISRTAALAAAVPQAGLDVAATFIPLGRNVAGTVLGPQVKQLLERGAKESAEKLARESLPTVLAKGAGISIATEAPTEAIQSMLERAQAGLPLLSEDAFKEYGEAAYQAALIAPIGSAARVGERSAARQEARPPELLPGETERQAAERIQAEILGLRQAAQPPAPGPVLSTNNLFNLMAQPNGYGLVEQYKQRLKALPQQTPEIKQAIEEAEFAQRRSVIEAAERRTPKAVETREEDVAKPVAEPSGEGVPVVGKPDTGAATEGVGAPVSSGVVPAVEDVGQPAAGEGQQPGAVAPKIEALQGSDTRLILPDGQKRPAKWEVIEADSVAAAMFEGRAQPRDRQRAASNAQVQSIAKNPDFDRLSDTSQTMDYGAPTLTNEYVIVGGNGRFEGVNLSYNTEAGQAYKQNLVSNAQRFGLDPAQVSGMKKPILIRKIPSESANPDDTRKLAIQSNIVAGLEMSDMERAALDSERMTNLQELDITDTGDIPLTTKNMGTIRDALKGYTKEELSGMLAADGSLSQSGLRRVKNAVLYRAYGKTDTLSRLLESPDADLKNVGTALMRASGNMSRLMDGIKSNAIPADYDIISDLTGAVETLSALRASGTKVQDFINQSDMFGDGISNEAKAILTFLDQNLRSAKSITEFLNDYANAAISAENAGDGLFGEVQLPSKQETIERAAQRPEAERAAAKAQQTIFEQPAGTPATEGAAKPEGEGRAPEGGEGAVVKKSLVEMRKRYEAGRAAPVETKPETTEVEKTEVDKAIEAKIEELGRVLSRILSRVGLKDVALNLVEDMKAEGEYSQSVIRLALDAASPVRALRHESIHALKELGFFTPQQWAALEKQAKSKWIDQYLKNVNINQEPLGEGEKSRYDAYMDLYKGDMDAIIEEAIADAFGDFDVNKAPPGLMQAILKRLRDLFDGIRTAFGGEITAEQVFRKVERGELGKVTEAGSQSITKESLRVMRGEEVPNLGKKVTVDMVGKYFDDQFIKEFGGKLDYNKPQDFDRAVQQATEEVQYQIKNDKSGLDWYEEDIQKAFKDTAKILPDLKNKESRILFSVIAGIMSPQTIARDNWFIAAKAFEHYVKTGDIPGINPENGNLWMGGTQAPNKKVQLEFLDKMVKDLGQKNALKWLMTPHSVKEINEFRSKYGNIKSGIDGKATDIKPGLYAFGPKIGPFVSNINGIHDVTVDKWFTRTFNRYFGTMIGPDGKIVDAPTEPQRRFIKELANKVAEDAGIKNYQVQSLLWFYEQRLFTELGAQSPSYGFSDGAVKFLESRGKGGGAGVAVPARPTGSGRVKPSLRAEEPFTSFDEEYPTRQSVIDGFQKGELVVHARTKDDTDFRYGIEPSLGDFVKSTESYQGMIEQYGDAPELTFFSDNASDIDTWAKFFAKRDKPVQMVFVRKSESMQKSIGNGKVMTSDGKTMSYEMSPLADYEDELMRAEPAFVETGDWYTNKDQDVVAVMDYIPSAKPSLREAPNTPEFKRWSGGAPVIGLRQDHVFVSGKPVVVEALHGTTNADITEFKKSKANIESDFGAGFYSSNTPEDVAINYANVEGADLTRRIENLAERIADNKEFDGDMAAATEEARRRLSQGAPNTMKLYMLFKNPAVLGGKGETFFDYTQSYNEETDEYGEPTGSLVDFINQLDEIGGGLDIGMRDIERVKEELVDEARDNEGLKFSQLAQIVKDGFSDAYSLEDGSAANGEVLRQALEGMGFDGVIDTNAYAKFGPRMIRGAYSMIKTEGMAGLDKDTVHFIAFKPTQIKSATGNIGTFSPTSPDIRYSLRGTSAAEAFNQEEINNLRKPDYKGREKLIEMPISDFLNLADDKTDTQKLNAARQRLDQGKQFSTLPYLQVGLDYRVDGHEGRHRAKALLENGYTSMPVILRMGGLRWDQQNDPNSFDYVKDWPQTLQAQSQAENPNLLVPFPVAREDSVKPYTAPTLKFSLRSATPADIRNRVLQTTVAREEKGFAQRITEAIAPESFSNFRAAALNRYNQLGVYDKKLAEKMGGVALLANNSAESAALLSDLGAGLTASALGVHDRMGGVPVYKNGITIISNKNNTIKGPTAIFAPLAKFNDPFAYQAYQFWAGVKRGSRFMADGREQLFEPKDIQKAEALRKQFLAQGVDFDAIQKEWIKFNDGLVDYMVDTGVLSKERADLYKKHSDYLPFYRQMDGEETVGPKIFQAISGVKPPKKLKGSKVSLDDFLETIVRNTQSAIQAGVKNVAAQRAADVAMKIQMARRLPYQSSAPNTFQVLENGKAVTYMSTDMLFINAIKSLGLPDLPFIGFLSGPANLLRNLVTKDPGFMLANLMRDSMSAWVTSGVKMTPMVDTISNFGSALTGKDPAFQALMNAGILGGYEFSQNVEQSGREFSKALRKQAKVRAPGYKGILEMGAKPFTSLWEALEKGSTASDAATRMEVYKKTLAETGNEAEALYRALEVMNFNRKGSSAVIRILTAAVPFLNARMQGLDVLYRAATGKIVGEKAAEIQKQFFVRGATIAALSAAYWLLTHDDEEYKKQEQETRDNYWLLPSLGVKIPIPFEIGVLFKVIPERILAYTFGSDTGEDFIKSMARQLTSTLAFNPIPQTVLPVVETMTNFSFFTMRPIVGQGLEGLQPAYQVGPGTSRLAEMIGDATKGMAKELQISPMKVDQLINGYTGTMGMYLVNLMDAVYDMNTDSPKPSMRFERMPLIRRFALDPEARGAVTAYYELKNSVDSIVRTSNMLERTMNYEELPGYLQDNMRMLATKDYLLDLEKTMKEFREMKIMIRSSQMDADAKKDAILSIDQMENQLTANIQYLKSLAKGG